MRDLSYLNAFYANYDEEGRLLSRHGQVEFLTTLRYVERYLAPGMRILDVGAGTGRYAHTLAQRGFCVDAVELVQANIDVFCKHTQPGEPVTVRQGDALELGAFADGSYDLVLLLGPLYHLYSESEKLRALHEALRVLKPGGVLFAAYCMMDASILDYGFRRGNIHELLKKNLLNTETFYARSTPAEVFELVRTEDIDALLAQLPAKRLHLIGMDLYTKHMRGCVDEMDDNTFAIYLQYHFTICERADMLGFTHHALDVLQKL